MLPESNTIPSFADFAKDAQKELKERGMGSSFLSKLPDGLYPVQFLGATMVKNEFGPGYIPEYKFNHDGVEKTLRSASKKVAAALLGKEGANVVLERSFSEKMKKHFWDIK